MFLWVTRSSTEGLTESRHHTTDAQRPSVCVWEGVFSLVSSPVHLHSAPFLLTAKNSTTHTHAYKNLFLLYCSVYLDTLTHAHSDGQQRRSHQICPLKEPGRLDVSSERDVIASCIFKAFEWKKLFLSQALAALVLTPDLLNCAVLPVLNLFLFSRCTIVKSI